MPTGTFPIVYFPSWFVCAPICFPRRITTAPDMGPPLPSLTLPVMVPVCAKDCAGRSPATTATKNTASAGAKAPALRREIMIGMA